MLIFWITEPKSSLLECRPVDNCTYVYEENSSRPNWFLVLKYGNLYAGIHSQAFRIA